MRFASLAGAASLATMLIVAFPFDTAHADWPPTGAPVAPAHRGSQFPFAIAEDGAGGVFVGWWSIQLWGSHLTRDGHLAPGWPPEGLRYQSPQTFFFITNAPDGSGGVFVIFNAKDCIAHCGPDPSERRVLRLTAEGHLSEGWPALGAPVGGGWGPVQSGSSDVGMTAVTPDGSGGLLVEWARHVGWFRTDPVELRLQRMSGAGARLWGDSGRVVRMASPIFPSHAFAGDGRGGAISCWLDERPPHLYAQRLDSDGATQWTANGIPLASDPVVALAGPLAVEDGSRGAIVAWFGAAGADSGIFVVRVTAGGALPWHGPVRVLSASHGIDGLRLVPARNGDAVLVWRDARIPGNETIHAQRIGHGGKLQWDTGPLPVCVAPGPKDHVAAAPDNEGGVYIAWGDTRPEGRVFATHLDRQGRTLDGWDVGGTPVCEPVAELWDVQMVRDGFGAAIVAWTDARVPHGVTQAMRLLPNGPASRESKPVAGVSREAPPVAGTASAENFTLRGMSPNPGSGGSVIRFSLPDAARAALSLFDLNGRRVWTRDVGGLGAGDHAIRFEDGGQLPPGVYLARLTRGDATTSARVSIIR